MTMKATELADLDSEQLAERLAEAKKELFNLRFQNVTGQLDNQHRLREVRKDIARIFTVMRQRELAGEAEPVAAAATRPAGRRRRRG
jgi:large subunit ribosomal protein L29